MSSSAGSNKATVRDSAVIDADRLQILETEFRPFNDTMEALTSIHGTTDQVLHESGRKGLWSVSCDGHGLRRDFAPPMGRGFRERVKLNDDLIMTLCLITPRYPLSHRLVHDRSVTFGTQLHAAREVTPIHNTEEDNLMVLGALFGKTESEYVMLPNETFTAVNFMSSHGDNSRVMGIMTPNLGALLDDCIAEESSGLDTCFTHHKANIAMRHCTNEILSSTYSGRLRFDYLRAKAGELICHLEDQCGQLSHEKTQAPYKLIQSDRDLLLTVTDNIRKNPGGDFRITVLAQEAGMSESRLMAVFRKYFNESIHQYVVRVRMDYAKKLLTETDLSIRDVAERTGYRDLSGFGRAYRKFYGVGPSVQRNM